MIGHTHDWQEWSRVYVLPVTNLRSVQVGDDSDTFLAVVSGFTSVELRCRTCGDLKNVRLLGKHEGAAS